MLISHFDDERIRGEKRVNVSSGPAGADKGGRMSIKCVVIILIVLLAAVLSGCLADQWSPVEPGEYSIVTGVGTAGAMADQAIQRLVVDRTRDELIFTLVDGTGP